MLRPQQTLDHPQVQALGLLQPLDYPGLPKPAPVGRLPLTPTISQRPDRQRAPLLGEHTDQVLAELGYSAHEIERARPR